MVIKSDLSIFKLFYCSYNNDTTHVDEYLKTEEMKKLEEMIELNLRNADEINFEVISACLMHLKNGEM